MVSTFYRVFQRKTWCFELLVWHGFWIVGLLIKLGVVLIIGNLCLINHLKLFWPQTASAASDKKCQNSKVFLPHFCPNFYWSEWQLTWYRQDLFGFIVVMQVNFFPPIIFWSVAKRLKKTILLLNLSGKLLFSANIES